MRTLVEVKTAELIGPTLDWAVAKAAEYEPSVYRADGLDGSVSYDIGLPTMSVKKPYTRWSPSTDWSQGGHLLERLGDVEIMQRAADDFLIFEREGLDTGSAEWRQEGPTLLIAICRSLVAKELGDVVQVPAELVGGAL